MSISISFSKTENKLPDTNESAKELPVKMVPGFYSGAESYFSPDGKKLIFNAKVNKDDKEFHVYTVNIDGTDKRLINDKGEDACSYFFPDGKRLVFTSTRDNLNLPPGDYSKPEDYPTGAELYMCGIDGSNRKRLTFNKYYDAEVSVSPDGNWILFGRQINGQMDLWRMRPDGSGEIQVTHSPDLQEGGAFYLPDSKHIIFRAWKIEDQTKRGKPMTIYTIDDNGKDLKPLTTDSSTNWSPHPAPDGKHFVFVKVLMPHNFEVFLMNMETGKQTRVTYNKAFDAFPSFSPDGKTISFSSTRDAEKDVRGMSIYLMDISSLLSK
jgi:Tol biopolymer transport system component